MTEPTFILGLGAQKAGTTWLHQQLDENDNVDMGLIKEYHIHDFFCDPLEHGVLKHRVNGFLKEFEKLEQQGEATEIATSKAAVWLSLYAHPGSYYGYFHSLLRQEGITLTGDITPSYSKLPVERLQTIKQEFAAIGVRVKCVFLMRDPVERLWSAVRMQQRRKLRKRGDDTIKLNEDRGVQGKIKHPRSKARGDYASTLAGIENVFSEEDRFVGLYETITKDPNEWDRLQGIIGQDIKAPDYDTRYNAGEKLSVLSEKTMQSVVDEYQDSYYAAMKLGFDVQTHWESSKFLPSSP